MMKHFGISFLLAGLLTIAGFAMAENQISTLRGTAALDENGTPPPISSISNTDLRKVRNYPEQPPLIPHKIDGYQIDINSNKCLECHQRTAIEQSQAPMVSVTHFMSRDGQVLSEVSPRRYFCTQCHVTQHDARPLLTNTFVDSKDIVDFLKDKSKGTK